MSGWYAFIGRTAATGTAADVADAVRAVAGRNASRYVADTAGIARSTARTWLRSTPTSRVHRLRDLVADAAVAAIRFRRAELIKVGDAAGRTPVYYKNNPDKHEGDRPIPWIRVTANVAAYLGDAANDLLQGNHEMAQDATSDAIICGYEDGLEDTLGVLEWDNVDIQ